jgi:hypothetical protein
LVFSATCRRGIRPIVIADRIMTKLYRAKKIQLHVDVRKIAKRSCLRH